jgi:hypothetical protein
MSRANKIERQSEERRGNKSHVPISKLGMGEKTKKPNHKTKLKRTKKTEP